MAITKETKISSIEVVGEFKNINVKKIISIKEDGNVMCYVLNTCLARHRTSAKFIMAAHWLCVQI